MVTLYVIFIRISSMKIIIINIIRNLRRINQTYPNPL